MNKAKIKYVFELLAEGSKPFMIDSASFGADTLLMASSENDALGDWVWVNDIETMPEEVTVREMEISELIQHYPAWKTTLGMLREFPGWQDAGQRGEADWEENTPVIVYPDGSVQIDEENGYVDLCPAPRTVENSDWIIWLSTHYGRD